MQLVLFNPLIWALSGATTPGQSGPGGNGNDGVLRILSITGTSPSDCLVSYPGLSWWWWGSVTPLQKRSRCILQPKPTGQSILNESVYTI